MTFKLNIRQIMVALFWCIFFTLLMAIRQISTQYVAIQHRQPVYFNMSDSTWSNFHPQK
jgi:hypothetical protein